jgi:hypothetical protein
MCRQGVVLGAKEHSREIWDGMGCTETQYKKGKASGKSSSIVVIEKAIKLVKSIFELKDYVEANLPEYDVRVSV